MGDEVDHYPDSYWLGQNEDQMLVMLDFLEAGGSYDELPSQPLLKTMAAAASPNKAESPSTFYP